MLTTRLLEMLKSLHGSDHCTLQQCFQPNIDGRRDSFSTTCSRSCSNIQEVDTIWKEFLVKVEIQLVALFSQFCLLVLCQPVLKQDTRMFIGWVQFSPCFVSSDKLLLPAL